jgi:regulator of replication initiation timing
MVSMSKLAVASSAAATAAVASNANSGEGKNPIRRVVTLMQDMQSELQEEGKKEDELYKKFSCYCSGNTDNLTKAGEGAAAQIEELSAKVKAEKAEKKQVAGELKQHKVDRATAEQDLKKATSIRKKENEMYVKESGDTKVNIDQTKGAIKALESGMGATAFIQTPFASQLKALVGSVEGVDASDRETLVSFLQASGDYVPAAGQIVGILKNMLDEMDKALGGIVKDEDSAAASFKALKGAKQKEVALATKAIESKTERVGELAVSIVQNENGAKDATADLEDSQKFLANLAVTCKDKKAEYEERVTARNDEVAAISEAIAVLNDDDALDVFKSAMPRANKGAVLLQKMSTKGSAISKTKMFVKNVLSAAKKSNPAVALIANAVSSKLSAGNKVDFSSVMKMIDDMVALLKKEQADDEAHRDYCNGEFDSSDDEKKATEQKLAALTSSISSMRDEIASISEKVSELTTENANLDKSMADASATRKEENAAFTDKVQLNKAAIELIFKAKNRLQKFYNPDLHVAAEVAAPTEAELEHSFKVSFLQLKKISLVSSQSQSQNGVDLEAAPEAEFGTAKTQKSNSVMALMDKLTGEMETEVKEEQMAEKQASKDYEELMGDAAENKGANIKSIGDKTKSKADLETSLEEAKSQKIVTSDALATVTGYIADLHQSCDFITQNFETRRESRTSEVEGLKNAKAVLSGASFSM